MAKDEYISSNLYQMTKNDAKFNAASAMVNNTVTSDNLSKAQLRRLSDVYNARLDLMGRMERSVTRLAMLNDELENSIARRRQAAELLKGNLEKLQALAEPDGGRELHEYMREVEHLRMEYFRIETEIEPLLENSAGNKKDGSFWEELSTMKAGHLLKLSFCGMFPLIITVLISALIVGAAVIMAMKI